MILKQKGSASMHCAHVRKRKMRSGTVLSGLIGLFAGAVAISGPVFADNQSPPALADLAISGTAIAEVVDHIDPSLPLGSCTEDADFDQLRIILPNLRNSQGNVRLSLYRGLKNEWLKKGMKILRYDVPAQIGRMEVCMPLPYGPGEYGLALYHDEDADTDYDFTSEGYGFSNNAKAQLFGPAKFKRAVFTAMPGETRQDIRIRY